MANLFSNLLKTFINRKCKNQWNVTVLLLNQSTVVFFKVLSYCLLFLLFINDLNLAQYPIHSYAYDTTLHFSVLCNRHPTPQKLWGAIRCLTSALSLVSDGGRANPVLFNASKTQFLQPYTGKLEHSSFVCFSTCLWLEFFQKRSECQDTYHAKLDFHPLPLFLLLSSV